MSYSIPDIKFENPGLLIPNRPPIGKMTIDWNHRLSKSLVGAWILRRNGGFFEDLTGVNNGIHSGSLTYWKTNHGEGVSITDDGTTDRILLGSITSGNRLCNAGAQDHSVYAFAQIPDNSTTVGNTNPRIIEKADGANGQNGWTFYWNLGTHKIAYAINGTTKTSNDLSAIEGTNASIGVSKDSTTTYFYANGVFDTQNAISSAFPTATTNACIGNLNHSSDRQYRGYPIYCIYVWNRTISANEHASIHKDRYQFIIPK